jgi:S1-C subfamily serine protease
LNLGEKMLIVRDSPQSFEEIVTYILPSVIAIAVGSDNNGRPIIEGTGFAVEHSGIFATCWHVASKYKKLSRLDDDEVRAQDMQDNFLRIAVRLKDGSYMWHKVEKGTLMSDTAENHDLCVFRLIDVAIPPLALHHDDSFNLGAEVGVIGFPMGNKLQGDVLRPYVIKSIISGALEYTMQDDTKTPQVALGTLISNGFSGGPVFSTTDGKVMGMVRSQKYERDEGDPKSFVKMPAGISLAIVPSLIAKGMHDLYKISTENIQGALWPDRYPEKID